MAARCPAGPEPITIRSNCCIALTHCRQSGPRPDMGSLEILCTAPGNRMPARANPATVVAVDRPHRLIVEGRAPGFLDSRPDGFHGVLLFPHSELHTNCQPVTRTVVTPAIDEKGPA